MPSWNDGETSSDSLPSECFEGQYGSTPPSPKPERILVPEFTGYDDCDLRCKHDMPMYRYVCFEGEDTGRRFLGCGCKDEAMCDTVHWVDKEWPCTLKQALVKLWCMHDEERDTRIHGNVEYDTKNYQLVQQKRELEQRNLELHKQLGDTLEYVAEATTHEIDVAKMHEAQHEIASLKVAKKKLESEVAKRQKLDEQVASLEEEKKKLECELEAAKMMQNVDAQVSILKEENKKLEHYVAELLKHHHAYKEKMKKIIAICGE